MVADRVRLFPAQRDNEAFAASLLDILRDHPFAHLVVSEAAPSPFDRFNGKPGFVLEAHQEDGRKWRSTVWFTQAKFTPENVEKRIREILHEWKNFYLKSARN